MTTSHGYDWNQYENGHYPNGGPSELHSVYGQIHAGPHPVPTHTDSALEGSTSTINGNNTGSGAFVTAGTAGHDGFDLRSLGLSEQELREAGLYPSAVNSPHQLPLDQYKINYDPNPIIIRKQIPIEMPTYKQQVIVRYLRPPTPPEPGPLIIKEVREPQPAAAPPLIIRTRAPREKTPPPIVIREAPPQAPQIDTNPHYVTRVVRHAESSYSSPQPQYHHQQYQQQQQQQQFNTINNGAVNYQHSDFNGNQHHQFQNGVNANNFFGDQQQTAWVTELVSNDGVTAPAPSHLMDDIYRAVNNQLPRV